METERQIAIQLAEQAGRIIKRNFVAGMKKDWKVDGTPVTVTDTIINKLVIDTVKENFPSHSVLGEEESNENKSDYVWVCDPVDGTIPFSHSLPLTTFSLALVHNGESVLGVINDPFMGRLLVASKGEGATLNGEPMAVSATDGLRGVIVNIESWKGFPYEIGPLKQELIQDHDAFAITLCAMVYSGILVAMGEMGASIFTGKTPWDIAAVKVIVEEAGGKVTDLFGNDQPYDRGTRGAIVSNGKLHDQLVELARKYL